MGKRGNSPRCLVGVRSGKLVVEEMVFHEGRTRCFCKCDCGKNRIVTASYISSGKCTSCGCDKSKRKSRNKTWVGHEEISGTFWSTICNNAKQSKKVKDFSISIEEVWDLFLHQERRCALSGIVLKFPSSRYDREGTASLDRIDSDKGYVKGNIQWVHKEVNRSKNDLDQNRYLEICRWVTEWKLQQS